jgi:hypothetical protein
VVDRKQPPDATKAVTFEVELERLLTSLIVIAEWERLWRVLATAGLTLKALAAGAVKA